MLVALRVPATPDRAFGAFTEEISQWWRPHALFPFTAGRTGELEFETGPDGRLVERYDDGTTFTIGEVRQWDPPRALALTWRQDSFADDQTTELHVSFDDVGEGQTLLTVEHFGWDGIPADHAARHGFPLGAFSQRYAEWWQVLLGAMATTLRARP